MLGIVKKQPGDALDYDVDFDRWLTEGDLLSHAVVTADAGLTVDRHQVIPPVLRIWLSGGAAGQSYKVTAQVYTIEGRVKEIDFIVRVAEC